MHPVEYRVAAVNDMPRLAALRLPGEPGGASAERMVAYAAGTHHPQRAKGPRVVVGAWEGDRAFEAMGSRPIGYVAGHLTERFGCDGELQWLFVAPPYRRHGVATALLHHVSRWFVAQGARRVCVDVGDEAAHRFYVARGARPLRPHWLVWDDVGPLEALTVTG